MPNQRFRLPRQPGAHGESRFAGGASGSNQEFREAGRSQSAALIVHKGDAFFPDRMNTKTIFFLLLILSATGFISPPIALCAGIIFGLAFLNPFATDSRALARFLLQASVVALGFGMNLHEVLKAGRNGFIYTAVGITFALLAGVLIGKILVMRGATSYLISVGTAICGGSAIAAVGPIKTP